MQKFRTLACASTLCFLTAACGGAPEPAAETEQATAPAPAAPAAAPASEEGDADRPRLVPPVRGVAELGYLKPVVGTQNKEGQTFVVTKLEVKNLSDGAIAGLRLEENWYDEGGNVVTGSQYRHPRPLQPGEVVSITLETPNHPDMDRNSYAFTHANGQVNAVLQANFDKEPAEQQ